MNINDLGAVAVSSQFQSVRSVLRVPYYLKFLENPNGNPKSMTPYHLMNINDLGATVWP